jgi:hypothetical protein
MEEPIGSKLATSYDVISRQNVLKEVLRVLHHPDSVLLDSSKVVGNVPQLTEAHTSIMVVLKAASL